MDVDDYEPRNSVEEKRRGQQKDRERKEPEKTSKTTAGRREKGNWKIAKKKGSIRFGSGSNSNHNPLTLPNACIDPNLWSKPLMNRVRL